MRDDYYSAAWADNRKHLSTTIAAAIHKVIRGMNDVFAWKHAYDFDAPWRRQPRPSKSTDCHTAV